MLHYRYHLRKTKTKVVAGLAYNVNHPKYQLIDQLAWNVTKDIYLICIRHVGINNNIFIKYDPRKVDFHIVIYT